MSKKKFNPIQFAEYTKNKLTHAGFGDYEVRIYEIDTKHYHFTVNKFGFDFVTICNDYTNEDPHQFDLIIDMVDDQMFGDNLMFAIEVADLIKLAVNIINSFTAE